MKNFCYEPIIRNGAAKFNPMNSMSIYIAKPNEANVAIIADKLPKNPNHGFDLTTSPIIHVIMLLAIDLKKKKSFFSFFKRNNWIFKGILPKSTH